MATGQAVSLIGSSAVQFSLIWWLASETNSPVMLAFSGLLAFLPQALLGPFAGVWIDRLKRKFVVIGADMFTGVIAVLFAAAFLGGDPPYWMACVVLGMRALGGVFHTPAIQAVVPLLVPQEALVKANGWSQFMQSGAFMLGPVLGAAMFAALPLPVILLTDFAGAAVASICIAVIKIPEIPVQTHTHKKHFLKELKDGAALFLQDKKLFAMTATATGCMIFFLPLSSYYPLMSSGYFQVSAFYGSIVELAYAAGMMICSLLMGLFGAIHHKLAVAQWGLFGVGITSIICGVLPADMWAFWVFTAMCGVMGASGNVYNIPVIAYLQETIPHEAQGRVFSIIGSLMSLAMPVGLVISGPVAQKYGVALWFFITGAATLVLVGLNACYLALLNKRSKMQS